LVSDLALGTMLFGEDSSRSTPPKEAEKQVHRFLDAGGNHIDTADVYADGRSEEIVGKALHEKRKDVILATKVRFPTGKSINEQGLSRHHIIEGVHASLRRLNTDYIDLYYMHCWDPITPLEESLRAFDDLITAGKIRYIGVSNFKSWQVMKAISVSNSRLYSRFIAAQYQYSLVNRDIEYEFTDLCKEEGIGIIPWGPLGGGFLSGKYKKGQRPQNSSEGRIADTGEQTEEHWERRDTRRNWNIIDQVGEIADARGSSYPQIALAWLRMQENVSSVIMGARTMKQLEDNLKAAEISLTKEELNKLNKASEMPELYPYRMIEVYGSRQA